MYYRFDIACLSAIGALFFFNLLIALTLRKPEYTYYSAYIFFVMLALITLDGLGFYYLWPDSPALNDRALHSFNILSASMRLLTIVSFLGIASLAPRLYRAALGLLGLLALTFILVNLLGVSNLPRFTAPTPWLMGIIYGFVLCGYAIHKQVKLAVPLLITLLVPTLSGITQAAIIIGSGNINVLELQIAKIGFVIHILMFSLCLAARIRIEAASRIDALHDNLTGLPGTTLLNERFQVAANHAQPQGSQIAVFFIDLDGFKAVNDQLGHAAGDQMLNIIASRLQQQLRRTDTVARIGGDEFVVLLTQVKERSSVLEVANKLLQTVAEPCVISGVRTGVSASIGIAMHPEQGEDLETLLKAADKAMYKAKAGGKNTCKIAEMASAEVVGTDEASSTPATSTATTTATTTDSNMTLPPYSTV
jgi:diguanylate cyclase (GGDEF)-like protein